MKKIQYHAAHCQPVGVDDVNVNLANCGTAGNSVAPGAHDKAESKLN